MLLNLLRLMLTLNLIVFGCYIVTVRFVLNCNTHSRTLLLSAVERLPNHSLYIRSRRYSRGVSWSPQLYPHRRLLGICFLWGTFSWTYAAIEQCWWNINYIIMCHNILSYISNFFSIWLSTNSKYYFTHRHITMHNLYRVY